MNNINLNKKVENQPEHVAASFTYNDLDAQDEKKDAAKQWTARGELNGHLKQSKVQV